MKLPDESGDSLHRFADGVQRRPSLALQIIGVDDLVGALRLVDPSEKHEFVLDDATGGTGPTRRHVSQSAPFQFLFAAKY